MPDADFSKGTTSFSPGITLSTQKFLSTCNVLVHPLQWGDRGRGVSEQWSSLALTCDTVFPLSLCGDPPQKQEAEDHSRRWHVSSGYCGLEKCAYWSDPQPAELRVLTEPTHQSDYHIMFLGSWIRSILIVCGESLLPGPMFGRVLPWGSFFSRGLSCFLIPEVLPIPPVLSNSELWDPGGRISTGNAWCTPAVFMNTCSKSKRRPLFELDVENQSSFFNHKKLLTWKDLKGLESTPPPTLTFRISSVNLKRNKQKENHSPDIS